MPLLDEIGKTIEYLRKQNGFTQELLALKCAISVSYLRLIEHGKANPTIKELCMIAEVLGVELCNPFTDSYQPFMKKQHSSVAPASSLAETFRLPLEVNEIHIFRDGTSYPVCPRCNITLEREFQTYCDRCGQALNWKSFHSARIVSIK